MGEHAVLAPGFGIVGNQPGGDFLYLSKYSNGNGYLGSGSVYPQNIQLKNLKWEEKTTYNLGIDYGFFNDIITGDFEVYQQNTKDTLMLNRGIPTSSGFTSFAYQNVGDMRNTGWEFNLNANRFIKAGKLSFDANITIANNKNRITSMDETVLKGLNSEFNHSNGSYLTRVEINKPFGGIYGFRYKGVYAYSEYSEQEVKGISGPNAPVVRDANGQVVLDERGRTKPMYFSYGASSQYEFKGGDAIYEDVNHDGNINELDIVYLGSSLPKLTGGFGFKVHYGNWTLNSQFNFRYGNKIINRARMLAENMYSNNNQSLGGRLALACRGRHYGNTSCPLSEWIQLAGLRPLYRKRFVYPPQLCTVVLLDAIKDGYVAGSAPAIFLCLSQQPFLPYQIFGS